MFNSWIKRSSLKRKVSQRAIMMATPSRPSLVMLLTLVGFFIAIGVFVMSKSYAAGTYLNGR
ncbi:MAG TPA: hypothetical protein VLI05_07150 [Candidatus Saccharimonadia bacterium]|nr:hypothetical protein [Candidatus Saccharimonadia bacterium]